VNSPAAKRAIMPGVEHRQHKGLNNRADEFLGRTENLFIESQM
jgi:transposase-like protein